MEVLTRFLIYLMVFGTVLYLLSMWGKRGNEEIGGIKKPTGSKPHSWFRTKMDPRELWMQVYETASVDEARSLQARLQEEEIECVLYEQGRKDIHGNSMKGIGVAVPKTAAPHSQSVISRSLS
ncbi:MAG: hypothetical protein EXS63_02025 [Candidatus Omnitrophica bacterium]|nr:hypothetical protein [Candidatus Omnitrophota bacterium]